MNLYDNIIIETAKRFVLDPALIKAICRKESNFDQYVMRFEPWFMLRYVIKRHKDIYPSTRLREFANIPNMDISETVFRSTSFGLMQIMGQSCRDLGYHGKHGRLLDIETNIIWGCKILKGKIDRYGRNGGISAYNQGDDRKNDTGEFVNQKYVDDVLRYRGLYEHDFS